MAREQTQVSKHVRQICVIFLRFLTYGNRDLWPFELKIDTPVTLALKKVHTNFVVPRLCAFELGTRTGQTDRQTDGRAIRVMRPIGRPHNKITSISLNYLQ